MAKRQDDESVTPVEPELLLVGTREQLTERGIDRMQKETESRKRETEKSSSVVEQNTHGNRLAEKHFSVGELSEQWNLSTDSIRRLFENEPGVLVFKNNQPYKRAYKTLRIPESVAMRVYRRSTIIEMKSHSIPS